MTNQNQTPARKFFAQSLRVENELFNCDCFLEDGVYVVDIFHSTGSELSGIFVESWEGEDISKLEQFIADWVYPYLNALIQNSIERTEKYLAEVDARRAAKKAQA